MGSQGLSLWGLISPSTQGLDGTPEAFGCPFKHVTQVAKSDGGRAVKWESPLVEQANLSVCL